MTILTDEEILEICKEAQDDSKSGSLDNFWNIVHALLIKQERKTLTGLHGKINKMKLDAVTVKK